MHYRFVCALVLFAFLVTIESSLCAQSDDPTANVASEQGGKVEEAEPEIYYFEDAQGNLIPVPGIPFEKLEEWYRLQRNLLPPEPPLYVFAGALQLDGQVNGSHVDLKVAVSIQIRDAEAKTDDEPDENATARPPNLSWLRIPLRLNQAIREVEVIHDGPGDLLLTYSEGVDGHVAWLRSPRGSQHTIKFRAKVPLTRVGAQTQMSLSVPAARSQLHLTISKTDLEVTSGNEIASILDTGNQDDRTELDIDTVGSRIEIQWRQRESGPPALVSSSDWTCRLVGRQIECQVQLRVRSHGKAISSFKLQLPAGAQLIPTGDTRHEVDVIDDQAMEDGRQRVAIVKRKDESESTEFDLQLMTVRQLSEQEINGERIDVSGFAVQDAVRQTGTIDFHVEGELDIIWSKGPYVRQVVVPDDVLEEERQSTRFRFYRQPLELGLIIRERESTVSVEPTYVLDVGDQFVRLEAILKYTVRGMQVSQLQYNFGAWELEPDSFPSEFITDIKEDGIKPLQITLSPNAQTATGEFELHLVATQPLTRDELTTRWSLPTPKDCDSVPASVIVLSASNVQLTAVPDEMLGLIPESLPAEVAIPMRQQLPLHYREETSTESSVFAADVQIRQQEVTAVVRSRCAMSEEEIEIRQQVEYHVEYVPLDEVTFEVPPGVSVEGLQAFYSGSPVSFQAIEDEAGVVQEIVVSLPEPRIGDCEVVLVRSESSERLSFEDSTSVSIGLLQPLQTDSLQVTANEMRFEIPDGWAVGLQDESWSEINPQLDLDQRPSSAFDSQAPVDAIVVSVSATLPREQDKTTVEAVWLQTWLTRTVRRERVSYKITTNGRRIQIAMPPGVTPDGLEVAVNSKKMAAAVNSELLTIDLEEVNETEAYTVEIWYWSDVATNPIRRVKAAIPEITGVERVQQAFWQVVVPKNEHVLWSPISLTPEYVWQWSVNHWGRNPNRNERQLEQLLGTTSQDPLPNHTHQYLFSSVGPLRPVEYAIADRTVIVLAVSSMVLLVGLFLIYFSFLRHPAMLLLLGLLVLSLGLAFPEPAVIATQAAVLGLLLVATSRVIRWAIGPLQPRPVLLGIEPANSNARTEVRSAFTDQSDGLPSTLSPHDVSLSVADSDS